MQLLVGIALKLDPDPTKNDPAVSCEVWICMGLRPNGWRFPNFAQVNFSFMAPPVVGSDLVGFRNDFQ